MKKLRLYDGYKEDVIELLYDYCTAEMVRKVSHRNLTLMILNYVVDQGLFKIVLENSIVYDRTTREIIGETKVLESVVKI